MTRTCPSLILLFIFTFCLMGFTQDHRVADQRPNGLNPDPAIEKRIDSLLALMTLEEKVGQLVQYNGYAELTGPGGKSGNTLEKYNRIKSGGVGSMLNVIGAEATREAQRLAVEESRLGIPMIFGYDVVHGFKTMFPIPLGEAASWDVDLMEAGARIGATEATAAGIHWTFAPMVDIARDARWGRVMEGAGEDPYLGARAAAARVRGFQGNDLGANNTLAACAKHFAAYGWAEGGLDYNTVDLSEATLRNIVLPPFKAAAEEGVATFMNAFNTIGGVPATGHVHLQRDILKGEWGFRGFVVSDWASIYEMVRHGVAADRREAAELAITAGSDMDMEGYCYEEALVDLVREGQVAETTIDDAVRRVLRIKFMLGIMDDPYKYCDAAREKNSILTDDHLLAARDAARKSIVLLKNDNDLLPLRKSGQTIAVIGPLAADKDVPLGSWRARAVTGTAVSLLEGIENAVGDLSTIQYAKGCDLAVGDRGFTQDLTINTTDRGGIPAAAALAKTADVVVLAVGEDCWQTGEGRSQVDIGLAGVQPELVDAVLEANPNTVVVLMNGRPLAIPELAERAPAILEAWHLGSEAGNGIADVLFGDYNPSGKLPISFPRHVGQCPIYYNHLSTGRPTNIEGNVFWLHYTDEENSPLYPFGYGLSYTTFEYDNLRLSNELMDMDGELTVSVDLTNTGERSGAEVVQLYIRDLVGSLSRPVKELKGFQKTELAPGETQTITFTLTAEDLAFFTRAGKWQAEPGEFQVFIGGNSVDLLEGSFVLRR